MKERKQFIRGLALGLMYGIIGNVVASHYYRLFEGLSRGLYDNLFYSNLVMLLVSLFIIGVLTKIWYGELRKIDTRFEILREKLRKYSPEG